MEEFEKDYCTHSLYKVKSVKIALIGLLLKGPIVDLFDTVCLVILGGRLAVVGSLFNTIGILFFIIGLVELLRIESKTVICSTLFFLCLWMYSAIRFPQNLVYLKDNATQFFIYVLPFFWIGKYLLDSGEYLDDLVRIAKIKCVLVIITWLIGITIPYASVYEDYMDASNAIIIGLLATYYLAYKYRRYSDICLSIVGTILLLIAGSRGVLLSLVTFWILLFIFSEKKSSGKTIAVVLGIVLLPFYKTFLKIIGTIVSMTGTSAHLILALSSGSFFQDDLRMHLFNNFWERAWREPFGYGIMGDRYMSLHDGFWSKAQYPHNIYLELLINFGYIIGSIVAIWLTYRIIKLLLIKDDKIKNMVILLVSGCFVKLLVSGSYWSDQFFFMLLSLVLYAGKETKKITILTIGNRGRY